MPELSYDNIPTPTDPDPARTERSRRALRQMILGETPADLLSPQTLPVVTEARFAEIRAALRPYAERANELAYVRSDPPDGEVERHTYRIMLEGETQYVTFVWRDGLLLGLRREDE